MVTASAVISGIGHRWLSASVTSLIVMWMMSAWCRCDSADVIRLGKKLDLKQDIRIVIHLLLYFLQGSLFKREARASK